MNERIKDKIKEIETYLMQLEEIMLDHFGYSGQPLSLNIG